MPAAVVRRDFLERLARPLLVRLLEPHVALLAERRFSLDELRLTPQDDRTLPRALYTLLEERGGEPSLEEVGVRLGAVAKLANATGREALIELDVDRALPTLLGAEDLAATAFLDFRSLFDKARGASANDAVKGFVLYSAANDDALAVTAAGLEVVRQRLSAFFKSRHRTEFCEVLATKRGSEHHFEIVHGQAPATHDVIDPELRAKVVTQVNGQRSYALYNEETRLLSVHAIEFLKEPIRESFSHGLGGDAAYFRKAESLVSLSHITDLDAALAPDLSLGVAAVELRELQLLADDASNATFAVPKGDVRRTMMHGAVTTLLANGGCKPVAMKLAFTLVLEGGSPKRPLLVSIRGLRNQLDYDRRDARAEEALLAWLALRGIWNGAVRDSGAGDESFARATA